MKDDRWIKANRPTKVVKVKVFKTKFGEIGGPDPKSFNFRRASEEQVSSGDPCWSVLVTCRTGLDRETTTLRSFTSQAEADKFRDDLLAGDATLSEVGFPDRLSSLGEHAWLMFTAGDDDYWFLVFECLVGAGVIEEAGYRISDKVVSWVGSENVERMKQTDLLPIVSANLG